MKTSKYTQWDDRGGIIGYSDDDIEKLTIEWQGATLEKLSKELRLTADQLEGFYKYEADSGA